MACSVAGQDLPVDVVEGLMSRILSLRRRRGGVVMERGEMQRCMCDAQILTSVPSWRRWWSAKPGSE